MSSSIILAGLGMAAVGFGGRYIARTMPHLAKKAEEVVYNYCDFVFLI